MVRIIHTSDTHLGYSQYHLSKRQDDFLDAFAQVIDAAISEDVDAVVHAGDLFHNNRPTPTTIANTIKQLQRLNDENIPFLAIIGNHEETSGSQWVDIFNEVELSQRLTMDRPVSLNGVCFYGMDYVSQARREALQYEFAESDTCNTNILVGHGLFKPLSRGASWDAKEVLARSNISFDAFLLGDDHTPKTEVLDGTLTTYCGSTERTATDQREPRGYNIIEIDDDGEVSQSRHLLDTRQFVYIDEIMLSEGDDVSVVKDEIDTHPDLENSVVVVEVDGEGEPIMQAAVEQYVQSERGALKAKFYDRRDADGDGASFDVQFADPDRAVDERLREMDLSEFSIELEREVRGDDVAKTTLKDETQETVKTALKKRPEVFDTTATFDDETESVPNNTDTGTSADEDSDVDVGDTWDEQYDELNSEDESEPVEIDDSDDESEPADQTTDTEPTTTETSTEPSSGTETDTETETQTTDDVDVVSIDELVNDSSSQTETESENDDSNSQPNLTDF